MPDLQTERVTVDSLLTSIEERFGAFADTLSNVANAQPVNLGKSTRQEDDEYFSLPTGFGQEVVEAMTDTTIPDEIVKLAREAQFKEMIAQDNAVRYHCSRPQAVQVCSNAANRVRHDFRLTYEASI